MTIALTRSPWRCSAFALDREEGRAGRRRFTLDHMPGCPDC